MRALLSERVRHQVRGNESDESRTSARLPSSRRDAGIATSFDTVSPTNREMLMMERAAATREFQESRSAFLARKRYVLTALLSSLMVVGVIAAAASPSGSAPLVRQLAPSYSLSFHNISKDLYTNGALTGVKETAQGAISGKMIIVLPLYGSGPFTGTVTKNHVALKVKSTVPNPCDCISGTFTGTLSSQGSITGTYVGLTKWGTENGTWQAIPHRDFNCTFRSIANGKLATTEVGYPGMLGGALRAQAAKVGAWEKYKCVAIGVNLYAIKSRANGRYVTAEINYPGALRGELRARSRTVGKWEKFTLVSVHSCSCFALRATNSKYVTAELGYPGSAQALLRAGSATIGRGQKFEMTIAG